MSQSCQIVIPARLASTRLPEKLLRKVRGKSILQYTYESACRSAVAAGVVVAVDDVRLADEVDSFGGRWVMTSKDCPSGTDRIAEAAQAVDDVDVFVNVQGDEPEIDAKVIDAVASTLLANATADIATAGAPIRNRNLLDNPACVKIVMANDPEVRAGQGRAVYFSRAPVPMVRSGLDTETLGSEPPLFWHHIGLYAYRRSFLDWFASQSPSSLEQAESLEQLRAIEAGKRIVVARVDSAAPGIDTPEDLEAFTRRIEVSN